LLDAVKGDGQSDRSAANQNGDMSDSSEILVSEGTDDAVADGPDSSDWRRLGEPSNGSRRHVRKVNHQR